MNPSIFPPSTSASRWPRRGPAAVDVGRVVVRRLAPPVGIGHADRRHAVLHRDAVGARIGPEVTVEGAVLLFDDDDVLDLVDAGRHHVVAGRSARYDLGLGRWALEELPHALRVRARTAAAGGGTDKDLASRRFRCRRPVENGTRWS